MKLFRDKDIPGFPLYCAATASDANMMGLMRPGYICDGVAFSKDQHRNLLKFYGVDLKAIAADSAQMKVEIDAAQAQARADWAAAPDKWGGREKDGKRLKDPKDLKPFDPEANTRFIVAGSERNAYRAVERDGKRIMAAISKFLEEGQDPVKLVLLALSEVGYDVTEGDWLYGDEGDGGEDLAPDLDHYEDDDGIYTGTER